MKRKVKLFWMLGLCLALGAVLSACSGGGGGGTGRASLPPQEEEAGSGTYVFTDAAGREVELPRHITRIASAGSMANIMLYAVKPEAIVGWSALPPDTAKKYMAESYWELPEYGKFYGGAGDFNREALMASAPEVIIDVGEWDEAYRADLDALQEQTGIPVILIEGDLEQTPDAYRTLGKLLGEEERGSPCRLLRGGHGGCEGKGHVYPRGGTHPGLLRTGRWPVHHAQRHDPRADL